MTDDLKRRYTLTTETATIEVEIDIAWLANQVAARALRNRTGRATAMNDGLKARVTEKRRRAGTK
jgi:hypothetical protein